MAIFFYISSPSFSPASSCALARHSFNVVWRETTRSPRSDFRAPLAAGYPGAFPIFSQPPPTGLAHFQRSDNRVMVIYVETSARRNLFAEQSLPAKRNRVGEGAKYCKGWGFFFLFLFMVFAGLDVEGAFFELLMLVPRRSNMHVSGIPAESRCRR